MPVNILFAFIVGSALGWLVNLLTKSPPHLRGLVIGCCAAGKLLIYANFLYMLREHEDVFSNVEESRSPVPLASM